MRGLNDRPMYEPLIVITPKTAKILIGEATVTPLQKLRDLLWGGALEQEWSVSYKPAAGKEFTLSVYAKQGMFANGITKIATFVRSGDRSRCVKTWNVQKVFYPKPIIERPKLLEIPSIKTHPRSEQMSSVGEKVDFHTRDHRWWTLPQ